MLGFCSESAVQCPNSLLTDGIVAMATKNRRLFSLPERPSRLHSVGNESLARSFGPSASGAGEQRNETQEDPRKSLKVAQRLQALAARALALRSPSGPSWNSFVVGVAVFKLGGKCR